jgi:hypothetical protein
MILISFSSSLWSVRMFICEHAPCEAPIINHDAKCQNIECYSETCSYMSTRKAVWWCFLPNNVWQNHIICNVKYVKARYLGTWDTLRYQQIHIYIPVLMRAWGHTKTPRRYINSATPYWHNTLKQTQEKRTCVFSSKQQ